MSRRYLDVEDVLNAIGDGNDSDTGGVGSEDDSDGDDDYEPNSISTLQTGEAEEELSGSDWDNNDVLPLQQQLGAIQPPKRRKKDTNKYTWRKRSYDAPDTTFTGDLLDAPEEVGTPYEYFQLFVNKDMLSNLAENTNIYAMQKSGKELGVTAKELQQVIGMFFRMGLTKMPCSRMYWEKDTRYEQVADIMSRNRFLEILAHLHFVDNLTATEEQKKSDKLWKIRPWLTKFRENCLKLLPEEFNSIDEQMVPFKGKFSGIKQYMRNKPRKWGFKIWCRCGISGQLYDFDIYQGSGPEAVEQSIGLSGDVVVKLCSTLPEGKNYKAIADNFFTSMPLILKLKERGIYFLGTVRANRLPNCQLQEEKYLKKNGRGSYDYRVETTHQVCGVRWYDNRAVTLASSYLGPQPLDAVKRWEKSSKQHVSVPRPYMVKTYNNLMGGVNFLDSLISKYRYPIKSRRWYLYLYWHSITTGLIQAWLLYRRHCRARGTSKKSTLNHRKFQAAVATALIMVDVPVQQRGRPSGEVVKIYAPKTSRVQQPDDVRYDLVGHFPIKLTKRGRCFLRKDGFTTTTCEKCDVRLCFNEKRNCFRGYHVR